MRRDLGRHALVLSRPNLEDPGVQRALAASRPDVLLSWFWPKRIPPGLLALPARGAYGVHPSLLPRWRGPDPYFWAIVSGDSETGVSLHTLEPEYDTGAVLRQERLPIDPHENAWSLARRLDRLGLPLLVAAARQLSAGAAPSGRTQDAQAVTQAPRPDEGDLAIDWDRSADEIARLVRAAAPYPGASAELGEVLVDIVAARPLASELPRALAPAEAVLLEGNVVVQTGRGALLLEAVRDEAGRTLRAAAIQGLFPRGLSSLAAGSVETRESAREQDSDASGKNRP